MLCECHWSFCPVICNARYTHLPVTMKGMGAEHAATRKHSGEVRTVFLSVQSNTGTFFSLDSLSLLSV